MRLAVITIAIGEHYQQLSTLTHPTIRRYADRIGADFIAITEQKISETTPHWEKFQLLDYLNTYDRILYVDTDVLIRKNCPNIFIPTLWSLKSASMSFAAGSELAK